MKRLLLHTTLGLSVFMVSTFLYANVHIPSFYANSYGQMSWVERWFTLNEATTIYGLPAATAHLNIRCVTHSLVLQASVNQPEHLVPHAEDADNPMTSPKLEYQRPCYAYKQLPKHCKYPAPRELASEQEGILFHHPLNHQGDKVSPFSLPSLEPMTPDIQSSLHRTLFDGPDYKG